MRKLLNMLIAIFTILLMSTGAFAQSPDVPNEINAALDELSQKIGVDVSLNDLDGYEWQQRSFDTTALGCPEEGQVYSQVVTDGFQFLLTYSGTTYDYRTTFGATNIVECDSSTAPPTNGSSVGVIPRPDGGMTTPCGSQATVVEGDTLVAIAERCNTTVNALVEANDFITTPNTILNVGDVVQIPISANTTFNPTVTMYPLYGSAGTPVTVIATGFSPNTTVNVGIGRWRSEYDILQQTTTDPAGGLQTQVTIPASSTQNEYWVVVINEANGQREAISYPFYVGTPQPTNEQPDDGDDTTDNLFRETTYYLIQTGTNGAIGCGDSLAPITVSIEPTIAPMTAAYENLLAINQQTPQGFYNALANSNLAITDATIINGVAEVYLEGNLSIGGTCDTPRVEAQLTQTALQYSTVDTVTVYINGEPLADVLSAR